jgi:hypothetical protein
MRRVVPREQIVERALEEWLKKTFSFAWWLDFIDQLRINEVFLMNAVEILSPMICDI